MRAKPGPAQCSALRVDSACHPQFVSHDFAFYSLRGIPFSFHSKLKELGYTLINLPVGFPQHQPLESRDARKSTLLESGSYRSFWERLSTFRAGGYWFRSHVCSQNLHHCSSSACYLEAVALPACQASLWQAESFPHLRYPMLCNTSQKPDSNDCRMRGIITRIRRP